MSGWKRRLAARLIGAGRPILLPLGGSRLRVLNYHRINYGGRDFALDDGVISASPEMFERQVKFCVRHFDVMTFRDLEDALNERVQLPERPLIFTFDDGYDDNHRYAYPILRAHGASAMFFLAVDYIDTSRLFWWDELALLFKRFDGTELVWRLGETFRRFDLTSRARRLAGFRSALDALKRVSDEERRSAIAQLDSQGGASVSTDRPPRQAMTWREVRELVAGGMEIGSHSMSHPILARVGSDEQLVHETAESKRVIEAQTGQPVSVFSYPVGGADAISGRVVNAVQAAGYRFAVSYVNGSSRLDGHLDRYGLKRLHIDGLDEPEFRARVLLPQV